MMGLNKSLVFCLFTLSLLLNLSSVEAKSKKKRYIPCLTQKKKSWLKKLKTRPLRVRTKALSPNDIKITEERAVIIIGAIKKIAEHSAIGKDTNPRKKNKFAKTKRKPRNK